MACGLGPVACIRFMEGLHRVVKRFIEGSKKVCRGCIVLQRFM